MLMQAPTPYPLGWVVDNGTIPVEAGHNGFTEQRQFTVTTPTGGTATCDVLSRGTVGNKLCIFHAGTQGDSWFDGYSKMSGSMASIASAGFRVMQVRWTSPNGWVNGPDGYRGGIGNMSSRPATLYRYLHATYGNGQKLTLVGHSGGATTIAYSLIKHRLAPIVGRALFVAGPVMVDVYRSCSGAAGFEAHRLQFSQQAGGGTAQLPDLAAGYAGVGTDPCAVGQLSGLSAEQWRNSGLFKSGPGGTPVRTPGDWLMSGVDLRFHRHLLDNSQVVPDAQMVRDALTALGRPFTVIEVANTDHNPNTQEAADAILASVTAA
jgi:hypothetical protein